MDSVLDRLIDLEPTVDDFRTLVLESLHKPQKELPSKFFYDEAGSALFNEICTLPEYYPTRTEMRIFETKGQEIAETLGPGCRVLEYGFGSDQKATRLLSALQDPKAFAPVDISREHLLAGAQRIDEAFPELTVTPVCADFTEPLSPPGGQSENWTGFFPGSTIGNFAPEVACTFLHGAAHEVAALLIGIDLKKDPAVLHAAYNDAAGVTEAFNKNVLARINAELEANFDLDAFAHYAFYEPRSGRIEMHLISLCDQTVSIGNVDIPFREGESIHTEYSYKYTVSAFQDLCRRAGFVPKNVWLDDEKLFSVHYLVSEIAGRDM